MRWTMIVAVCWLASRWPSLLLRFQIQAPVRSTPTSGTTTTASVPLFPSLVYTTAPEATLYIDGAWYSRAASVHMGRVFVGSTDLVHLIEQSKKIDNPDCGACEHGIRRFPACTCTCLPGWQGVHCSVAVPPPSAPPTVASTTLVPDFYELDSDTQIDSTLFMCGGWGFLFETNQVQHLSYLVCDSSKHPCQTYFQKEAPWCCAPGVVCDTEDQPCEHSKSRDACLSQSKCAFCGQDHCVTRAVAGGRCETRNPQILGNWSILRRDQPVPLRNSERNLYLQFYEGIDFQNMSAMVLARALVNRLQWSGDILSFICLNATLCLRAEQPPLWVETTSPTSFWLQRVKLDGTAHIYNHRGQCLKRSHWQTLGQYGVDVPSDVDPVLWGPGTECVAVLLQDIRRQAGSSAVVLQ